MSPYRLKVDRRKRDYRVRYERIELAIKYLGGCCCECASMKGLQFHHRDPEKKEFKLTGRAAEVSLERFWKEVKKCLLLCWSCHLAKHGKTLDDGDGTASKQDTERGMYIDEDDWQELIS